MTSSIKWEPIEDLKAVRDVVDRALVQPWVRRFGARVPVDLYETEDAFVAEVDAPGLAAEDLEVTVSGTRLRIKGKRKVAEVQRYVYHERSAGRLMCTLVVPRQVAADRIHAKLDSGVLAVVMPKKAATGKVEVEVVPDEKAADKES